MEKVNTKVWESKDRAIDAQSSVKSAVTLFAGIGGDYKMKDTLELAEKFYQFIQSKRSSQVDSVEIPE